MNYIMVIYNGHALVRLAFATFAPAEQSHPRRLIEAAAHEEKCAIHIANIGTHQQGIPHVILAPKP